MTASHAPAYDLYLLVHPEQYPGEDPEPLGIPVFDDEDMDVADDWYGEQIRAGARLAGGRTLLITDDEREIDLFERQGRCGLTGRMDSTDEAVRLVGVEYLEAPFTPAVAAELLKQRAQGLKRVLVGGFHREDCVAKVIAGLQSLGVDAQLHCPSTLPQPSSAYLTGSMRD